MLFSKDTFKRRPHLWVWGPCLLLSGGAGFASEFHQATPPSEATPTVAITFSPKRSCTPLLTQAIGEAKEELHLAVYSFNSEPIGQALAAAKKRGVKVYLIVDAKEYKKGNAPQADRLVGIVDQVYLDQRNGYAHNKVIIVDRCAVTTGSFNFDEHADGRNRENVLYLRNYPELVAQYYNNWQENATACTPMKAQT